MIDLSFVILTWNSSNYLARCLDSFISQCMKENISWEIIIIDNGSTDGTQDLVKHYCNIYKGQIHLLPLKENLGTTYPRNLGLNQAKGNACCILDSDTEFDSGSIGDILNSLDNENIGIIAPKLLLPDNIIQNSVKKFPTFIDKLSKIPGIIFNKNVSKNDFYKDFPFHEPCPVDTAISACWFFKKTLLKRVGFFDEAIFYAPEDVDYCLRVNQARLQIIYFPSISILHHTQQISHRKPLSKVSRSHFIGLLYYFKKHGGWFQRPTFSHVPE